MAGSVYAIATMDTKGRELAYVAAALSRHVPVRTVDVGTGGAPTAAPDIPRERVLGNSIAALEAADRGDAVTEMGQALTRFLASESADGKVSGVIGLGGSGGTALVTAAMRSLPVGLPKLMVSTVASGNVAPYIDCSDITMMPSVVDVAGLNVVSKRLLSNAAHAMAGMVSASTAEVFEAEPHRPAAGMTMFGVTTPCVTEVRQVLESLGFDTLVFHATGVGGRAMEKLVASGMLTGVLDVTTTEVADEVVGGVMPAGSHRFDAILTSGIPYVVSLGACDMVNFGAQETVPEPFTDRLLHVHNAHVTLMRTSTEENKAIARWIAAKLNRSTAPVTILIPEQGLSMLDRPGQPFHDPQADAALFETLEAELQQTSQRRIIRVNHHINDRAFAQATVEEFTRLCNRGESGQTA